VEKSKKRAERRWRSRCVWMRRLKQDWNEHGWKRDPTYDYDLVGKRVIQYLSDRTTLCACFDLEDREAYRFKNTPNTNSFRRKDLDKYRDGRACRVPIQELRAAPVDREFFGRRKRRRHGTYRAKVQCFCGYLLDIVEVTYGNGFGYTRARGSRCPGCRRAQALSGELYAP
jgi:hypothetical protein